ncbi:MAG: hypothetical protein DDT32_00836 [Syntrophomonadaceae bacterium]|nr:hypothetical protein [Bacillota bacterium]
MLYYAGFWGLGGCPKNEYNTNNNVNNQKSPLSEILPVEIVSVPDWEMKKESWGNPVLLDKTLGEGIDTSQWKIFGLHITKSRGEVLAELSGIPFICQSRYGKGRIIVYTGDDLAWVRAGGREGILNPFASILWQRLALLATGEDVKAIVPKAEVIPDWEKPASFAHPDQPINFLWAGYFYYGGIPEMERLWVKDLMTHSTNFYMDGNFTMPKVLGEAGIAGSLAGAGLSGYFAGVRPCVNDPAKLKSMEEAVAKKAAEMVAYPWIVSLHLGDEPEFGYCNCEYCQKKFKEEFGCELPELKNDFSPEYLDKWIDYCLFKNRAVGNMYSRAVKIAHQNNPNLKYGFASIPQTGGMAFGDDQFNTQSGFDLLWDHPYPGTQTIRSGLNSAILEETANLQNRPYVPVWSLLQGFDYPGNAPYMPPAEYMRAMAWQAIASLEGIDIM